MWLCLNFVCVCARAKATDANLAWVRVSLKLRELLRLLRETNPVICDQVARYLLSNLKGTGAGAPPTFSQQFMKPKPGIAGL